MTTQIPIDFICPNCNADVRISGVYERSVSNYKYDEKQQKFVFSGMDCSTDESVYCNECYEPLSENFELDVEIDRELNKLVRVRYGNHTKESTYTVD